MSQPNKLAVKPMRIFEKKEAHEKKGLAGERYGVFTKKGVTSLLTGWQGGKGKIGGTTQIKCPPKQKMIE